MDTKELLKVMWTGSRLYASLASAACLYFHGRVRGSALRATHYCEHGRPRHYVVYIVSGLVFSNVVGVSGRVFLYISAQEYQASLHGPF